MVTNEGITVLSNLTLYSLPVLVGLTDVRTCKLPGTLVGREHGVNYLAVSGLALYDVHWISSPPS